MFSCFSQPLTQRKVSRQNFQQNKHLFSNIMHKPQPSFKQNPNLYQPVLNHIHQSNKMKPQFQDKFNPLNLIGFAFQQMASIKQRFQSEFMFGVNLKIYGKGKIKQIKVFLDKNLPNMIWFTSQTKCYLFDLRHTEIDLFDYQMEKILNHRNYFILRYFEQQIPLLFQSLLQKLKYQKLFKFYKLSIQDKQHPPLFSRIMKLTLIQTSLSNIDNPRKTVQNILNISQNLKISNFWKNLQLLSKIWNNENQAKQMDSKTALDIKTKLRLPLIQRFFFIRHCQPNLISVYEKYSSTKLKDELSYLQKNMEFQSFKLFLQIQQKLSKNQVQSSIHLIGDRLSFFEFCLFLQNQQLNHAIQSIQIDQDLPLTDYFCYSSHNTYLSGNQLTSDSKIQRYIEDLQGGIKGLQIDIHNNGEIPIINHAFKDTSICKSIDFQETIKEMAKYCQSLNHHYPIVFSVQNHASQQNLPKIANIFLKYMGDKLFIVPSEYVNQKPVYSKTLRQLKNTIILQTAVKYSQIQGTSSQSASEMAKVTGIFRTEAGIQSKNSMGYQCTGINHSLIQQYKDGLIDYSKRSFLRIYPKGSHVMSGNFDPVPALQAGAQVIALNTQNKDDYVFMMMSYFRAGRPDDPSKTGYIQKPAYLRAFKYEPKPKIYKKISFKMISESKDIKLMLYGSQRDLKLNENPSGWQVCLQDYDQAFVIFQVTQSLKQCLPIRFIRPGYRVMVPRNINYKDSGLRLIVKISIEDIKTK